MLNVAVCDDDINDLNHMSEMLDKLFFESKLECNISLFQSSDEILNANDRIDIAILDIVMPDCNGIDLGNRLKEKHPEIMFIYTSSYENYYKLVINKVHAFSFLIKPVKINELKEQLFECVKKTRKNRHENIIMFENVRNSKGKEFASVRLNADDILYCESVKVQRETAIILKGETYYIKELFESISKRLENFGFIVNRRGCIVNLKYVQRMKGYTIYLDDGTELALAQKRVAYFKEKMNRYIHRSL